MILSVTGTFGIMLNELTKQKGLWTVPWLEQNKSTTKDLPGTMCYDK